MIVPIFETLKNDLSCVTLPRYAQILQYPETAFFGIQRDGDEAGVCREIWTKQQRDMIARNLWSAQQEIEKHINYFLSARWIVNEEHPYYESMTYLKKTHLISPGIRVSQKLGTITLDHTNDPSEGSLTISDEIAVEIGAISEIKIYHPNTETEIIASEITLPSETSEISVKIPRARLVKLNKLDNPSTGWDYTDVSEAGAFEESVDIYRVYNNRENYLTFLWRNGKSGNCLSCNEEEDATSCLTVLNYEKSFVITKPLRTIGKKPTISRISYYSGLTDEQITEPIVDAIIRLAHTKMPIQPCGCDAVVYLWKRDRETPEVLTSDRLNCPFGPSDGAWIAWQMVQLNLNIQRGLSL